MHKTPELNGKSPGTRSNAESNGTTPRKGMDQAFKTNRSQFANLNSLAVPIGSGPAAKVGASKNNAVGADDKADITRSGELIIYWEFETLNF